MPAEPLIAGRAFQRSRREADRRNPSVIVCGNIIATRGRCAGAHRTDDAAPLDHRIAPVHHR